MFELSIALKYLIPRFRQLSVSIISVISVLVIALVVWLIVVFFSVTNGLEKYWIDKLIAVTSPVRVVPTDAYYRSYYYQIDSVSDAADYRHKSIAEKRFARESNPYDPYMDQAVPRHWPPEDLRDDGALRDLVKDAFAAVEDIDDVRAGDYETTFGNIRLRLSRGVQHRVRNFRGDDDDQAFLAQAAMFGSLESDNPRLEQAVVPLRGVDVTNIVGMAGVVAEEGGASTDTTGRVRKVFEQLDIHKVQAAPEGWVIPHQLYPREGALRVIAVLGQAHPTQLLVTPTLAGLKNLAAELAGLGYRFAVAEVDFSPAGLLVRWERDGKSQEERSTAPLTVPTGYPFTAAVVEGSLERALHLEDVRLSVSVALQGITIEGTVPFRHLEISSFALQDSFEKEPAVSPPWLYRLADGASPAHFELPYDANVGDGVLLPKAFQNVGVLAGDRGYVSYYSPTPTSVQEQRVPVYVAGFYDPGMIPIGGKLVFVNRDITSTIRSAYGSQDRDNGEGIRVRFSDFERAEEIQAAIEQGLRDRGVDKYWKVETFRDYEFAREILQQQQSDKNLFMVIAAVIIVVACSNIISMLIILVKDKRLEIGILRSMGATSRSISMIFGTCGFVMGLVGSIIGSAAAILTLRYLDTLIGLVGKLQGHQLFNPTFYGETLPNELSPEALLFVLGITAVFSLLAGVVPAIKASLLKPSAILKSE